MEKENFLPHNDIYCLLQQLAACRAEVILTFFYSFQSKADWSDMNTSNAFPVFCCITNQQRGKDQNIIVLLYVLSEDFRDIIRNIILCIQISHCIIMTFSLLLYFYIALNKNILPADNLMREKDFPHFRISDVVASFIVNYLKIAKEFY